MFDCSKKKIFLTGGTGFFGKSILSRLKQGFLSETTFTILSRQPECFLAEHPELNGLANVEYITGDVRDFVFPSGQFDVVIHAATPAVTTLLPGEMSSIILDGTRHVLEFAKKCGAERMLLTSSGAVYGPQPTDLEWIPEDFPCRPVTEYGTAKLQAESICVESGIPTLIARCFAFTGPYLNRNIHFAIGNFIRDALANEPIIIQGDGTPLRSYLFADDLVEWLFTILEKGTFNFPYHVGSDEPICIADLAQRVKQTLNSRSPIEIHGRIRSGKSPERYIPSIFRAKQLGLSVKTSLEEAILRTHKGVRSEWHFG